MNVSGIGHVLAAAFDQAEGIGRLEDRRQEMPYEKPQYEIEISVIALGIAYAASLISLIVWIAV